MSTPIRSLRVNVVTLLVTVLFASASVAQAPAPRQPGDVRDHRTNQPGGSGDVRDHRTDRPNEKVEVRPNTQEPPVTEPPEGKSFWTTLPGLLTGLAGIIGAIAALIAAFRGKGK
jgi:hypothetical protein